MSPGLCQFTCDRVNTCIQILVVSKKGAEFENVVLYIKVQERLVEDNIRMRLENLVFTYTSGKDGHAILYCDDVLYDEIISRKIVSGRTQ